MKLNKSFRITSVTINDTERPFEIILDRNDLKGHLRDGKPNIALNKEAAKRLGVKVGSSLIGKTLECELESLRRSIHTIPIGTHSLDIRCIDSAHELSLGPASSKNSLSDGYQMRLETWSENGPAVTTPCPNFYFIIDLTKEEFKKCARSLDGHSLFVLKTLRIK